MTTKDKALAVRLKTLGYMLTWSVDDFYWIEDTFYRQHFAGPFTSVFSAASHMVTITRDDKLRKMVSGL